MEIGKVWGPLQEFETLDDENGNDGTGTTDFIQALDV